MEASERLSAAVGRIGTSATMRITARAAELRAAGVEVCALSAGEPDAPTPPHVAEAARRAVERGRIGYTPPQGLAELRSAISEDLRRRHGMICGPDEIIVTSGGKQAIFNALLATLDPGDEVIIPAPYWVSYPEIVRFAGARPVILPTGPERGWRPEPGALAARIGPRTRWLILNAPANPTGAGLDRATLEGLAEVLRAHPQVMVLSDDIYAAITYPPHRFTPLAAVAPDLAERILVVDGVSKAHAMTGWRIGWGAGPAWLIGAMTRIQSHSTSCASAVSQHAAIAALTGPQDHVAAMRAAFARRRARVLEGLGAIEGLRVHPPEGAFYAWIEVGELIGRQSAGGRSIGDDVELAEALLEEAGVALVPGSAFGWPGALRLSFAAADEVIERALERLPRFAAELR
ncbi:MAG: pyridoxal phosphate-dependent aminotransferase [Alphaproteobacteria bacterium]|nr:MAG: pyridoxal phosphate-dependent aminotransferase [Alphaproteobacteria bacterium]